MESGVARKPITDLQSYARDLSTGWIRPPARWRRSSRACAQLPRRVVFAEGEEEKVIRAAIAFRNAGYGTPVLVGREDRIEATMKAPSASRCRQARDPQRAPVGRTSRLRRIALRRLQRDGFLLRDCQRMVNQDRNVFAACMVAAGDADAARRAHITSHRLAIPGDASTRPTSRASCCRSSAAAR
jgi:malate dehydrogenase (oxaloacetate-decarboxylating)(NADP+)